jgi:hypothetical protein
MNPSNRPDGGPTREELAAQLSDELIRLRDALVSLSINLKDWQFEVDQSGRLASQKIVTEALCRFRLHPNSNPGSSETSSSQGAKD